jgi:hypothetical protein
VARKPNYDFERRRKELERKRKKEEKAQRKRDNSARLPDESDVPEAPAAGGSEEMEPT